MIKTQKDLESTICGLGGGKHVIIFLDLDKEKLSKLKLAVFDNLEVLLRENTS